MGNKLDAILAKPLHCQESSRSRGYESQRQQHNSPHHQRQSLDYYHGTRDEQTRQEKCDRKESYRPKQRNSFVGSFRRRKGKLSSCPDLLKETSPYYLANAPGISSGLGEYRTNSPEKTVDIKIYRSYTDLPQQTEADQPLKIKVYRKSQESLTNIGRVQSMPRGMNRNGSSEFSTSIESKLSVATQEYNRPPSRRSSSRCSTASSSVVVNCRASVNLDDFPNTEVVTKKISTFEQFFNNLVVKYFKNLTILDQLASICVAVMPDRANQSVSLLQYLQSIDIPPDLGRSQIGRRPSPGSPNQEIVSPLCPTLPDFLVDEILNAKLNTPPENQASVCQDVAVRIIAHLASESAREISRLYEYQLALIQETIAFRLLAKFAATNVFEAVKSRGRLLDRNSMITAAMNLQGRRSGVVDHAGSSFSSSSSSSSFSSSSSCPKWISVISFNKELKWNIYDIFRKAALRKDVFTPDQPRYTASPSLSPASIKRSGGAGLSPPPPSHFSAERRSLDPESSPWRFYASSESDPMTYGYRGQIVQWDFVRRCYRLSPSDESNFAEELPWRYDDLHRLYSPYFRLVCDSHLLDYCNWLRNFAPAAGHHRNHDPAGALWGADAVRPTVRGFEEFVRQFRSGVHVREEAKLIYRSVAGFDLHLSKDPRRSEAARLGLALLGVADDPTLHGPRVTAEVFAGTPLASQRSSVSGSEGGSHREAESLRKALAQVTMECDQLCYNLQDMESGK